MKKAGVISIFAFLMMCCVYANGQESLVEVRAQVGGETATDITSAQVPQESPSNLQKATSSQRNSGGKSGKNYKVDNDALKRVSDSLSMLYEKSGEIQSKLNMLNDSLNSLKRDVSGIQSKAENGEFCSTKLWVRILLFSLTSLLAAIVLWFVMRQRKLRNVMVETVTDSERVKEWLDGRYEKKTVSVVQKSYDNEILSLQNENRDLKKRVAALEDLLRDSTKSNETSPNDNKPSSSDSVEKQRLLYADSIIDGVFCRVRQQENDDSIFVLNLKNETSASASFSLCEHAYSRVLVNASFLDGCEKQIIGNRSVEIMREGEAEKGVDGKWKVVIPLKVEIR